MGNYDPEGYRYPMHLIPTGNRRWYTIWTALAEARAVCHHMRK